MEQLNTRESIDIAKQTKEINKYAKSTEWKKNAEDNH